MTWVLGWPLTIEYAREYVREHRVLPNVEHSDMRVVCAACEHINRRVRDDRLTTLACWVGDECVVILGICVDRKARTAAEAKPRLSRMPTEAAANRLASLLKVDDGPEWYRYDEKRYIPDDDSDDSDSDDGEYDDEECDEGALEEVEELADEKGAVVASDSVEHAGDKAHVVG